MENKEIEDMISKEIKSQLENGLMEKIISEKLESCISNVLKDTFNYTGEARDAINKKISEIIIPTIEKHDFSNYITKLDDVLTEIVNTTNITDNKTILDNFKELMIEPNKKTILLSTIFEQYCEYVAENINTSKLKPMHEDGEPYYEHVTAELKVKYDNGSSYSDFDNAEIELTCSEDEELNMKLKLYKWAKSNEWAILNTDEPLDITSLRDISKFKILLSKIKRSYSKIIINEEFLEDDDIEPYATPEWTLE